MISHDLADSGVDGGNAFDRSSVIIDRLARAGDGLTRSCRSQKEQAVFAADHHLVVLPDDHLSGKIILRGHDIDRLVGVHGHDPGLGQFLRHIGADDLHAVHTYNSIHHRAGNIILAHCPGSGLCLILSGFHCRHINVIIDMGVRGHKMPRNDLHNDIIIAGRTHLGITLHKNLPY